MRNNQKRRAAFEEPSYWQSFSDMMSALTLIFILIIAITLAIYRQKTTDLERTQVELNAAQQDLEQAKENLEQSRLEIEASNKELEQSLAELQAAYQQAAMTQEELNTAYQQIADAQANLENAQKELADTKSELQDIVGIRTDIIGELQERFNNSTMKVDPQTGSITFSADVLFSFNSYDISRQTQEILKEVIPMYLEVLLQDNYVPYIAEIIIEGHTDTVSDYQTNMVLSFNRANSVAKFCMNPANGLSEEKIELLRSLLTVNGRSFSNPVYDEETGEVDPEASRRVEIKFRLKEDEMIERIAEVLGQEPQTE